MATLAMLYSSPQTITIDPSSLASSSTFVAGRESTEIDNTSNLYVDALVEALVTVGTTPTANTLINIYAWGSHTSLATTALDVLDGTDSAETITNVGVLASGLRLAASGQVSATTSNVGIYIASFSIAQLFGAMPRYWGLFVAHNTVAALNATAGNHVFKYTGIKHTVA